jgi:apolipoprotein N-acyltransferase
MFCYYLALPPTNFFLLAFAVPVFFGKAITDSKEPPLKNRYAFLAACLFWFPSIWWVSYPNPVCLLGLTVLVFVLSLFLLLFFISAQVLVHRFYVPLPLAMPLCWIGCEYLRCSLWDGFSLCALEHAFYQTPILIQLASIGGQYLVGGAVMFFGASLVSAYYWKKRNRIPRWFFLTLVTLIFVAVGVFSYSRIVTVKSVTLHSPSFTVAALQGKILVKPKASFEEQYKKFQQFIDVTQYLMDENKKPDLLIFPETIYPPCFYEFNGLLKPEDDGLTSDHVVRPFTALEDYVKDIQTPLLIGCCLYRYKDTFPPERFNSAMFILPSKENTFYRYDKSIRVKFGEYIPCAEYVPEQFRIKPISSETTQGRRPVAMYLKTPTAECCFTPNICIESCVPAYIRNQVWVLRKEGHEVQMLVNLSCDGWFRFSREIDQHFAANVFRAVENGLWHLSATDCGFSAVIRPDGVIRSHGSRGQLNAVIENVHPAAVLSSIQLPTIYQRFGDWYALICSEFVFATVLYKIVSQLLMKNKPSANI